MQVKSEQVERRQDERDKWQDNKEQSKNKGGNRQVTRRSKIVNISKVEWKNGTK